VITIARPGSVRSLAASLVLAVLVTACGGGGGGGGGGPVTFSLSTNSVTFSAVSNGTAPASQTVTASAMNGTVYFSIQSTGNALASASLNCAGSSCQIALVPISPANAASGTYSSTVTVTGCTAQVGCGSQVTGSPQTINVAYTMAAGATLSAAPGGLGVAVSPAAGATQSIAIASSAASATAWQSSVNYVAGSGGWLTVAPTGNAPGNVSISVGALPPGSYRAVVTFAPAGGGTPARIVVVAVSHPAGAQFVSPYVATAGRSGEVIVRGSGFAALTAVQAQVLFGATPGSGVQVVSDTEIIATAPPLAAGRYVVTVKDSSQTLPGSPALVVVAAPAYAYARIARAANSDPVQFDHVLYDAERGAIYLYDVNTFGPAIGGQYADEIERYRFSGGSWTADVLYTVLPLGQMGSLNARGRIALTPDGGSLVRIGSFTIDQLSPVTGALLASTSPSDTFGAFANQTEMWDGAGTNDGYLLGSARNNNGVNTAPGFAFLYDAQTHACLPAPDAPTGATNLFQYSFAGSADGSRVLMTEGGNMPTAYLSYDSASAGYTTSAPLGTLNSSLVRLSRDGMRAILHADSTRYAVADFTGGHLANIIGYLPPPDAVAFVISPDGTRAYVYLPATNTIHAYDLTAAPDPSGQFPEIGTGLVLADAPGAAASGAEMIITPDGGALILAGTANVIVTPPPPG
jgi:hypothetical protein